MKILSPAGDLESLKMAVNYGADEVYLGIKDFNARNIEGFNLSTLKQALDYAHIFDVKVLVAINILFLDEELQSALDLIVDAYNLGVDAFIIQDLGLASLLQKYYPQIEMHASTQMGIHNLEGVKFIEKLGFKRVVLARETPLEEIKRIKQNSKLEIEYFAQGALCVSFSGNCYLSSYLCDASGNRGKCKQLCRLPYDFKFNDKTLNSGYLLSAKDFNMINRLSDLQEAGVDVLKIEGRARRPYYVGAVTDIYRKAIDNKTYNLEDLSLAFNRGFTEGYFNGNGNVISNYPAHIGIRIGKIEKIINGKNFNKVIVSSCYELNKKSVLKLFVKEKEVGVVSLYDLKKIDKNRYEFTTTQKLKGNEDVNLILDNNKEETVLNKTIKKNINIQIIAKENETIKAIYKFNGLDYFVEGDVLLSAKNQPLTDEEIKINFAKSEIFNAELEIFVEKVFLPKQQLNAFRRKVYENIYDNILKEKNKNLEKISLKLPKTIKKFDFFTKISKFSENLIENANKNIIYSPEFYMVEDINNFVNMCKIYNKKPFLDTPNFALQRDVELLKEIVDKTKIGVIANNYYAMDFNTEIIIGAGLNVYNHVTADFFDKPVITAESEISNKINFPYMTLRHCPMKSNLKANCENCPYKSGYYYVMQNGKVLTLQRKKLSTCTFYLIDTK